ncbi:hypothetical protein VTJ04DRAFT_954 [Mycothermus thermophilus]|uniref:uncharacterized protein n=1 Tax=Humicola insolens TaxID=85995 RepID=UPI003741F918
MFGPFPVPGLMRRRKRSFSTQPAATSLLLIALVCAIAVWNSVTGAGPLALHQPSSLLPRSPDTLHITSKNVDCLQVHHADDQCAFVLANCADQESGLLHYLSFYYCRLGNARFAALSILAFWLALLFTTIGIAASDFFSINLSTIASVLGMSENLAGVTLLAFGNGSPDVFSTFAAMGSNSGSMAVGELVGAAGFITAVVAGSMALVREFKVSRRTFVRDILFFIVAISFTMGFLADGELHLWECLAMIGFYVFYVFVVVSWHWLSVRQKRRRELDRAARSHVYVTPGASADELEPYRDEPEDEEEAAPVGRRAAAGAESGDISALERGPRIEVDGVPSLQDEEEEEERQNQVVTEMASSMRVNRPRWSRSNTTTITPIRPSLLGALEFRSVLSSLQKERNVQLGPLHTRSRSIQHFGDGGQENFQESFRGRGRTSTMPEDLLAGPPQRPLSRGDTSHPHSHPSSAAHSRTSSVTHTIDGLLAPPSPVPPLVEVDEAEGVGLPSSSRQGQQQPLRLQIPSSSGRASEHSSPALSPYHGLSESPALLTPLQDQQPPSSFQPPAASHPLLPSLRGIDDQESQPRPVRWWPYGILPPPHVLFGTLFPTLQGWNEKTLWDKVFSVFSVPSIFLLAVTLPVVESEKKPDDEVDGVVNTVSDAPTVTVQNGGVDVEGEGEESEWQAYRRRAHSISSGSALSRSPSYRSMDQLPPPALPAPKPFNLVADVTASSDTEVAGWNRWLVGVQLFTGPLFLAFVLWANLLQESPNPSRALVKSVLVALLVSLGLLAVLFLATTPDKKPRSHKLLSVLGFVMGITWISTIAGEVVGVLKALGIILNISEAILGLTIFAVGNSLGDLVSDVTIARLGYPVMALAACFGGPMLNILLGIGIGGAWMCLAAADRRQIKHPGLPRKYKPYRIRIGGTLIISAATVLVTLVTLLVAVPANRWIMSRRIGFVLIGIWSVGTLVNLIVEWKAGWGDVSELGCLFSAGRHCA